MHTSYAEPRAAFPAEKTQEAVANAEATPILFMCDFPPSNLRGGSVLIGRLLESYPRNRVVVLIGSYFNNVSPAEGRLSCKQLVFPTSNETGPWGLGRIKSLIDWLMMPLLTVYGLWVVKNHRTKVIVTIAHGHFFVAAALIGWVAGVPVVLMVHDDWVSGVVRGSLVLKYFCVPIFQFVTRRAAHVYAVTPYMGEMLATKYGVASEVQMPAIEPGIDAAASTVGPKNDECLRIVYAGTNTGATDDSLSLLLNLVKGEKLFSYGINSWELLLFVMATAEQVKAAGWEHERIKFQGWVSQEELESALTTADILFLPFSFREDERFATSQAFPSKAADYLKSGKPILIFAPPYSSLVKYARQFGFAEIVDEPSEEKLAQSIARIWGSAAYREQLGVNSQAALKANHDINKQRAEFKTLLKNLAHEAAEVNISSPA
jgi:glycosyltransferase involved in cell wall biosynthesis